MDPVSAIVASAASGVSYQPTLNVGAAPVNVPSGRLQAALADERFPYAITVGFRSKVSWEEVASVLGQTSAVTFEAKEVSAYGEVNYALIAEPENTDGLIVVEFDEDYGRWVVSVTAANQGTAERYMAAMTALLPSPPPPAPDPPDPYNVVPVDFWMQDPMSGYADSRRRRITVHSWDEVKGNYPGQLQSDLTDLMAVPEPSGGKLVLFHGPPGTGKTRAILTLISEWRDWCSASVVTDSDQFFGSATYLNSIVFNAEGMNRWLLLVIEDGDEFINVNGRDSKGQAIARLLNLCDGIVGQGINLLTLMSTNVDVEELNPAVVRDGRCMANLHFGDFSAAEGTAWLAERGVERELEKGMPLASLYKVLSDASV